MPCDVWLRLILIACCGVGAATMPHRRSYFTAVQGLTAAQRRRQERDNKYRTSTPGPDYGFLPVRLRDKSDARAMIAAKELHRDREMLLGSSTHHGRDASVLAAARGLITHAERNCDMKTYQRGHAAKHGTVSSSRHAVSVSKSFASVVADSHAQCVPEGHANAASAAASVHNLPCASSVARAGLDDAEPGDSLPVHRSEQSSTLACAVSTLVSEIRRVVQEEILSQTASLAANGLIARRVDTIEDKLAEIDRRGAESDARIATVTTGVAECKSGQVELWRGVQSLKRTVEEVGPATVTTIQSGVKEQLTELAACIFAKQNDRLSELSQVFEERFETIRSELHDVATGGSSDSARLDLVEAKLEQFATAISLPSWPGAIGPRDVQRQFDEHAKQLCLLSDTVGKGLEDERLQLRDEIERQRIGGKAALDNLGKQLCALKDRSDQQIEELKGDLVCMMLGENLNSSPPPARSESSDKLNGDAPDATVSVGCRVVLINLSRQDLNGSLGTAVSFNAASCRFGIKLDDGRTMSIKRENLVQHRLLPFHS